MPSKNGGLNILYVYKLIMLSIKCLLIQCSYIVIVCYKHIELDVQEKIIS